MTGQTFTGAPGNHFTWKAGCRQCNFSGNVRFEIVDEQDRYQADQKMHLRNQSIFVVLFYFGLIIE